MMKKEVNNMTLYINFMMVVFTIFILGTSVLLVKRICEMVAEEKEDRKRKEFRRLFELTDLRA